MGFYIPALKGKTVEKAFNSLYGILNPPAMKAASPTRLSIPFMGFLVEVDLIIYLLKNFQFPLWDSTWDAGLLEKLLMSFNSLYGIPLIPFR